MDLTQFSPSSALLTVIVLALAPFVGVMVTSFTKLVVVLSLLRNALGLQQVPPNVVLNGLALVLSIYVMYPVGSAMAERMQGVTELPGSTQGLLKAADSAKEPLRDFLIKHSRPLERAFFLEQGRDLCRTLARCLPGGTMDALLLALLERSGIPRPPFITDPKALEPGP